MTEGPITFTPHLLADDPLANYWMRQVTIRLRREICWLWQEHSKRHQCHSTPDSEKAKIPPFVDRVSASIDMVRYWEEKNTFFQTDQTAKYLTDELKTDPPLSSGYKHGSFGWIVDHFALDDATRFVLALGLAVSYDNAMGSVVACCLNDSTRILPNMALAQKLWDYPEKVLRLADPAHPLFRYGLLQSVSQTFHQFSVIDWENPIFVPALVSNQLLFSNCQLPEGLSTLSTGDCEDIYLTDNACLVASRLQQKIRDQKSEIRIVPICGQKGSAPVEIVRGIAKIAQRDVVEFKGDSHLLENNHYMNSLATFCWLRDMDLFLSEDMLFLLSGEKQRSFPSWLPLKSIPITIFFGITDRSQLGNIPGNFLLPVVNIERFSYSNRIAHWRKVLGEKAKGLDSIISECSRLFRYEKETINRISEGLKGLHEPFSEKDFVTACRAELDLDIGELAQKVIPRFEGEELILPHKENMQFLEIEKAMRSLTEVHYGWGTAKAWSEGGISVLFAGPPGTGKTMAAEVLAMKLDLPMYRIDLSQVVNKYIGETEKNLKKIFDAADISDTVLFFDEADALFGRRTEVKDAHDRFANIEIDYLLQRMERFKGLAILATNRKKDLDPAFLRRLRYVIDFPMPGEEERKKIWRYVIPRNVLFHLNVTYQTQLNVWGKDKDKDRKFLNDLQSEFQKNGVLLSNDATVSLIKKDHEWWIDDPEPPFEFSEYEFIQAFTTEKLCKVIEKYLDKITLKATENTIERLNELLENSDFIDRVRAKKPSSNISKKITDLENKTKDFKGKNFDMLSDENKNTIKKMNRLLLEEIYPKVTPKRREKRTFSVWKGKDKLFFYDDSRLDFGFLAKQFPLAGGHIRSIVFNACLQSANGSGRNMLKNENYKGWLRMEEVIVAVKREYGKLDRSISMEQFGPYASIIERIEYEEHTNQN